VNEDQLTLSNGNDQPEQDEAHNNRGGHSTDHLRRGSIWNHSIRNQAYGRGRGDRCVRATQR